MALGKQLGDRVVRGLGNEFEVRGVATRYLRLEHESVDRLDLCLEPVDENVCVVRLISGKANVLAASLYALASV